VLGRVLLVAVAVLAAGWLALGYRSAVLESRGAEAVDRATFGGLPAGEVERAQGWLRSARRFSADAGPLVIEGRLLFFAERTAQAADVGERVVAMEPENFDGWALLYTASRGRDPERAAEAFRALRELNPPAAEAFR
jgi:hypothetical protein